MCKTGRASVTGGPSLVRYGGSYVHSPESIGIPWHVVVEGRQSRKVHVPTKRQACKRKADVHTGDILAGLWPLPARSFHTLSPSSVLSPGRPGGELRPGLDRFGPSEGSHCPECPLASCKAVLEEAFAREACRPPSVPCGPPAQGSPSSVLWPSNALRPLLSFPANHLQDLRKSPPVSPERALPLRTVFGECLSESTSAGVRACWADQGANPSAPPCSGLWLACSWARRSRLSVALYDAPVMGASGGQVCRLQVE